MEHEKHTKNNNIDFRIEFNFDDIVDILQTINSMYNIENNLHPNINQQTEEYTRFKKWFQDKYIKSGMINEIIKKLN